MKMLNLLEAFCAGKERGGDAESQAVVEAMSILLRLLSPITPHIAWTLWKELGYDKQGDLLDAPWPQVDEAALVQEELELVLQINGKRRGSLFVPSAASNAEVEALVRTSELVLRYTEGRPIKKIVVVPGKLVNVVI
jgi:leucyl-tRNA synthetase